MALVHDLRGDPATRDEWLTLLDQLGVTPERRAGYCSTFDALALLHRSHAAEAMDRLTTQTDETNKWLHWIWLHWHVALRAEAAVLSHHLRRGSPSRQRPPLVAGNPVATAIVDRATALADGDHTGLLTVAAAFDSAGCPYEQARTLILAGPATAEAGRSALADLGLTA